ncbi:MAG: alpha/beta hydrolase [Sphingomonadaceae bacterium]|nr:alpha/beta hydrolase [Sphingomonadaceae bacterium]
MISIRTKLLEISYKDDGPSDAPVVLLLHGWPDDASTWDGIVPALNETGFRTIAPNARGFGQTRFLGPEVPRTGNAAMLALDAIDLLDRLAVGRFVVAGHDWGANIAEMLAVGWPDRVERIAMLSTPSRLGGLKTPPFWHARLQWYHWFQTTERGARAVRDDPKGFARIMWETWSPAGWFDDALFEKAAESFENPDWVDVTLHSYRSRWGEAEPDLLSKWLDDKVKSTSAIAVPAIYIQGEQDGVNPPPTSENVAEKYSGPFRRIVIPAVGHFPTREAPDEVAEQLVRHFTD